MDTMLKPINVTFDVGFGAPASARIPSSSVVFYGYTTGRQWNGYECPLFEQPDMEAVLKFMVDTGKLLRFRFDEKRKAFRVWERDGFDTEIGCTQYVRDGVTTCLYNPLDGWPFVSTGRTMRELAPGFGVVRFQSNAEPPQTKWTGTINDAACVDMPIQAPTKAMLAAMPAETVKAWGEALAPRSIADMTLEERNELARRVKAMQDATASAPFRITLTPEENTGLEMFFEMKRSAELASEAPYRTLTPEEVAERDRGFRAAAKPVRFAPRWVGDKGDDQHVAPKHTLIVRIDLTGKSSAHIKGIRSRIEQMLRVVDAATFDIEEIKP